VWISDTLLHKKEAFQSYCFSGRDKLKNKWMVFLFLITCLLNVAATKIPDVDDPPYSPSSSNDTDRNPGSSGAGGITQIFHILQFPFATMSEALTNVFVKGAEKQINKSGSELGNWAVVFGEIIHAPSEGLYQAVATSSLPVAAALAVPLFLLRLALYHWNRLSGENDSALRVIADWVAAAVLAAGSGWLVDLVVQTGWWMTGRVVGEASALGLSFARSGVSLDWLGEIKTSLFAPLIAIGLLMGSFVALAALAFGFAATQAALYILALLAAPLNIIAVVREMRWVRSLWLKAFVLASITPIVAGGIFKAVVAGGLFFTGHGFLTGFVRVLWLWGAAGAMLSLAGLLGKMTIGTSGEAMHSFVSGARSLAAKVALVASGVGATAAAGMMAAGTVSNTGMAGNSSVTGGAAGAVGGGIGGSSGAALQSYQNASTSMQRASLFDSLGMREPAQFWHNQARLQEMAGRQHEYADRMQRFAQQDFRRDNEQNDPSEEALSHLDPQQWNTISHHATQAGYNLDTLRISHPQEVREMLDYYARNQQQIDKNPDPFGYLLQNSGVDLNL
jgi:hypothetical protein